MSLIRIMVIYLLEELFTLAHTHAQSHTKVRARQVLKLPGVVLSLI